MIERNGISSPNKKIKENESLVYNGREEN